jgi:hypothetical protein
LKRLLLFLAFVIPSVGFAQEKVKVVTPFGDEYWLPPDEAADYNKRLKLWYDTDKELQPAYRFLEWKRQHPEVSMFPQKVLDDWAEGMQNSWFHPENKLAKMPEAASKAVSDNLWANATSDGWFADLKSKIKMAYWLLIVCLVALAALCGLGIVRRIVGK